MIDHVLKFPEMCEHAFTPILDGACDFEKIGVVGMGGSGIGGDLLKSYLRSRTNYPVIVNKDYDLPSSIDENTLLFVISYSGNTTETLTSLKEGIERGCEVGAISSDGQLKKIADEENFPLLEVPKGIQPRAAFPYLFLPILATLEKLDVINVNGLDELKSNLSMLKSELKPSVDLKDNLAKMIALELKDSIPVVYSYGSFSPVAYRWKCQFNENSKKFSIMNEFPELTHNEVVGWMDELTDKFNVVVLKEENPISRTRKKIEATLDVLDVNATVVEFVGDTLLSKMLTGVFIGDIVSVYLAQLNNVDPDPVARIDSIKNKLSE